MITFSAYYLVISRIVAVAANLYSLITTTVVRLEQCKYHGNFSIKLHGKRYTGTVLETKEEIPFKECCLKCVVTDHCKFVNHNDVTQTCELLKSDEYLYDSNNLVNNSDWMFAATKFSRKNVRLSDFI